jgi:hypothetical protein
VRIVDGGWIAADLAGHMPDLASIVGISLGVADVEKSASLLAHNGAGYQRIPGAVTVSRAHACGTFTRIPVGTRVSLLGCRIMGTVRSFATAGPVPIPASRVARSK